MKILGIGTIPHGKERGIILNRLKRLPVIHPFLFAIAPVLFLFAHNIYEVPAGDLLLPLVVVIIGVSILFFLLRLITKSYVKSGIITSWFLILFFIYIPVREAIYALGLGRTLDIGEFHFGPQFLLGPLWAFLFIAGAFLVTKAHRDFATSTKFLNVVAITLVTISLVNIGISEIKTPGHVVEEITKENTSLDSGNPDNLPDIYYIILDQYTRQDILEKVLNYDNSEFIDYLTSKGFYVATKSCSNYGWTHLSLPSSLNMDYLKAGEIDSEAVLLEMVKNSKVSRFLKEKGYRYIFVGGGIDCKGIAKHTDVHLVYKSGSILKKTDFVESLIHTTALSPFAVYLRGFLDEDDRKARLYAFDKLADIPNIKEPTFVYAHILCPHGPFVFDRNGNPPKRNIFEETRRGWCPLLDERYVDQVIFINKKVETLLDEIISKSDVEPVIILQGDHGIDWHPGGMRRYILNAYFLPGKDNRLLYESITPVNSFRIVFNLYFDTSYDLLEDKSYFLDMTPIPPESNSD